MSGRTGGILLVHPGPGSLWRRLVLGSASLAFAWKRDLVDHLPNEDGGKEGQSDEEDAGVPSEGAPQSDVTDLYLASHRLREGRLLTEPTGERLAGSRLRSRPSPLGLASDG